MNTLTPTQQKIMARATPYEWQTPHQLQARVGDLNTLQALNLLRRKRMPFGCVYKKCGPSPINNTGANQ